MSTKSSLNSVESSLDVDVDKVLKTRDAPHFRRITWVGEIEMGNYECEFGNDHQTMSSLDDNTFASWSKRMMFPNQLKGYLSFSVSVGGD